MRSAEKVCACSGAASAQADNRNSMVRRIVIHSPNSLPSCEGRRWLASPLSRSVRLRRTNGGRRRLSDVPRMRNLEAARASDRALVVHAPGAELARIHVEAEADVEAEPDTIFLAFPRMPFAQAGHHLRTRDRPHRNEVDGLHEAMRTLRRTLGALVEQLVA